MCGRYCIDKISYEIFEEYCGPEPNFKENVKKLAPILEVAIFLDFNEFEKICKIYLKISEILYKPEPEEKSWKTSLFLIQLMPDIRNNQKNFRKNQMNKNKMRNTSKNLQYKKSKKQINK